ncbi:MAG: EamA family transporter RarD [Peptostreptococcaceae bacterium]|nr:EamA family transporter RarD [Peptostreptococcaceae bacterium]
MRSKDYKIGMLCATFSAVTWGFLPIYWQALRPVDSVAIIFYRIIFVAIVTFIVSLKLYGMEGIKAPLRIKGNKLKFFLAGLLITLNWSIYIAAVNADFVIQTCIGYYIEPIIISAFGVILFKEKLGKYKTVALAFAGVGVFVMLVYYREIPMIALSLAITFALYTAIKKSYKLEAVLSLLYETMFLVPVAVGMVVYYEIHGIGALGVASNFQLFLLSLIGFCTAIPLILFTMGANRISMVSLGIIEYISPSITLLLGIFLFKEAFDTVQFFSFVIIWIGLVFFTYGEYKEVESCPGFQESPSGR